MTGTISIVKHSADGVLSGWQFRVTGTAKTGQSYDKTFTTDARVQSQSVISVSVITRLQRSRQVKRSVILPRTAKTLRSRPIL